MSFLHRDRSEGWTHAKLSGHSNEAAIYSLLQDNPEYREQFLSRLGKPRCEITDLRIGGLHETDVPSIISDGRLTKSKTDLWVKFDDGTTKNISIKKSAGGQVFLIKTERFIEGFQNHYQIQIPERVKCAMMLFWGAKENMSEYIKNFGDCDPRIHAYEVRKNRLVKASLARHDQSLPQELLLWFRQNIGLLADFCFARGLAKDCENWADMVWYKNMLNECSFDELYDISKICSRIQTLTDTNADVVYYGNTLGGSTIQLPFGFVQWHQNSMQFHHKFEKIQKLFCI